MHKVYKNKKRFNFKKMKDCVFCNIPKESILFETSDCIAMFDAYPVSKGHTLLISKKHYKTYFDLPEILRPSMDYWLRHIKDILDEKYRPDGYNVGFNCGESAGQTIDHFHIHIIPRYKGDVENPRGGVRGVIPSKQNY